MKYIKKPVEVEAIQFFYGNEESAIELNKFCGSHIKTTNHDVGDFLADIHSGVPTTLFVETLEGDMRISNGDYIIKGVNGEFYPCKPEIFNKTYDAVKSTFDFGTAIKYLEQGKCCLRKGWNGKGLFVYKQVPCTVPKENIADMKSTPDSAKKIISLNSGIIHFTSQCVIYNSFVSRADGWVPSISDVFAKDWILLED